MSDSQSTESLNGFGKKAWRRGTNQPMEQAPAYMSLASPGSSFAVGGVVSINCGANLP